jgi:hypothetical protein
MFDSISSFFNSTSSALGAACGVVAGIADEIGNSDVVASFNTGFDASRAAYAVRSATPKPV